ncbi:P-loop containing nucleoside triphosphate hydrolase protein [Syncephalastrum racemosum]|uniref:P-loop containing nucleoside triphosphate hydrolase protein n=1 Tax=Syncephalastrum racemosum TaxID=13706 RepID=A0A1X2HD00_SYNRA|nr:P-loop containing nucleoside triphosphate hydrolase protein [Syncephalastrum racemosum]
MPVQSSLIKAKTVFDLILTFLEKVTDEAFWESVLGQRLVNLGKRYFGNDFVVLSLVFYISSILGTRWQALLQMIYNRWHQRKDFVVVNLLKTDNSYQAVYHFVQSHAKEIPGLSTVFASYAPTQDDDNNSDDDEEVKPVVAFYPPEDIVTELEYKGHTIYVSRKSEDDDDNSGTKVSRFSRKYLEISMEDAPLSLLKQYIQEWCDIYNTKESNKTSIWKYDGYSSWYITKEMEPRPLETVTLKAGLKEQIMHDMTTFCRRKKWYKTRGIPYRRGYLLFGPPGTGKTSIIQALACKLNMDLALVSLLEISNDSCFAELMENAPEKTIIVMEDLDHYSSSDPAKRNVSMPGLLNALDGIQGQKGSMIFITCNDINKLPPALLRPGRIDLKCKLDYAEREQVEEMFWRFFGQDPDTMEPLQDGELKTKMEKTKKRFGKAIPSGYVTTAEIENYFITNIMEADAQNMEDSLFERIFDGIPTFLDKVIVDREQAKLEEAKRLREKTQRASGGYSDSGEDEEDENKGSDEEGNKEDGQKEETKDDDKQVEKDEHESKTDENGETETGIKESDKESADNSKDTDTVVGIAAEKEVTVGAENQVVEIHNNDDASSIDSAATKH